jgi:hypothetical protein
MMSVPVDNILDALDSCVNNPVHFSNTTGLGLPNKTIDIDQIFDTFQRPKLLDVPATKYQSDLFIKEIQKATTGSLKDLLIEEAIDTARYNSNLILQFLAHCERHKGATFYFREIYKYHLSRLERWTCSQMLTSLTSEDITRWISYLEQTGSSTSSITKAISIVHLLFNYLQIEGYIINNPIESLKLPQNKKFLTDTEIEELIVTLDIYASKSKESTNSVEKFIPTSPISSLPPGKQRQNPRIKMGLPLTLRAITDKGEHIHIQTETVEISRCGATVRSNHEIAVGTSVYIKMPFSDWLRAEVNGIWRDGTDKQGRIGLKLVNPRTWLGD